MKLIQKVSLLLLAIMMFSLLAACQSGNNETEAPKTPGITATATADKTSEETAIDPLWETAKYTENTTLGEGSKTISVTVEAGDKSIIFTVKTDEEFLGKALMDLGIIEGSEGPYGIMVEKVNGIQAIYDVDKAYWMLTINGEYAMSGADTTPIEDGGRFKWTYSKS